MRVIAATEPLDSKQFAQLGPRVRDELLKRIHAGVLRVGESLQQVFVEIFGTERTREEWYLFLLLAAPLARKIAIERASSGERIGNSHIVVADLRMWLSWLDRMDPLCARMIDLHYFAGLGFKETAAVLALPTAAIIRQLRFAKAWLMLRLE
jgi:DNA-directed RNA polymerase specialized sigma24 family protein